MYDLCIRKFYNQNSDLIYIYIERERENIRASFIKFTKSEVTLGGYSTDCTNIDKEMTSANFTDTYLKAMVSHMLPFCYAIDQNLMKTGNHLPPLDTLKLSQNVNFNIQGNFGNQNESHGNEWKNNS